MKEFLLIILPTVLSATSFSQNCSNAGFENGNLNGWTGTWGDGICITPGPLGACFVHGGNPFEFTGLNQGTDNQASNALPQKNHFIMTSGYDPVVGGTLLPVVFPGGGTYSMRLGNAQAENGGESIAYSFTVDANNPNFTYNYAVVLNDGGHAPGEQPLFRVRAFDQNNDTIQSASLDIDATTAQNLQGFSNAGGYTYNFWLTETIALESYLGQTVKIEFLTSDCNVDGGSHFAYVYLDAECGNTVGIAPPDNQSANIYPNPAKDMISVTTQSAVNSFQLHDISGKLLLERLVNKSNFNIDVSSLNSGFYFISLQGNEGRIVRKLELIK